MTSAAAAPRYGDRVEVKLSGRVVGRSEVAALVEHEADGETRREWIMDSVLTVTESAERAETPA